MTDPAQERDQVLRVLAKCKEAHDVLVGLQHYYDDLPIRAGERVLTLPEHIHRQDVKLCEIIRILQQLLKTAEGS